MANDAKVLCVCGSQCTDALAYQVLRVRPRAWVTVGIRHAEAQRNLDNIAAGDHGSGVHERYTNAPADRPHRRDIRRYLFNCLDLEIDGTVRLSADGLPCAGPERPWLIIYLVRGRVLWRKLAYTHHTAAHRATEAIGVADKLRLTEDWLLDLCACAPGRHPKRQHRDDRDLRHPAKAHNREQKKKQQRGN